MRTGRRAITQADRIRSFVIQSVIAPAHAVGQTAVVIRAGEVHASLGLANAHPAVCSALRGAKLQHEAGISLTGQEGPPNGANVWFHFNLAPAPLQSARMQPPPFHSAPRSAPTRRVPPISLRGTLVLISCTKSKLSYPALAADLYCSPAFRLKRRMVERDDADWIILSAEHGLVEPTQMIAPYDTTLTTMGIADRRAWAANVLPLLLPKAKSIGRVVALAGSSYIDHLVGPLADTGVEVAQPLKGLKQGQQLAWLTAQT